MHCSFRHKHEIIQLKSEYLHKTKPTLEKYPKLSYRACLVWFGLVCMVWNYRNFFRDLFCMQLHIHFVLQSNLIIEFFLCFYDTHNLSEQNLIFPCDVAKQHVLEIPVFYFL